MYWGNLTYLSGFADASTQAGSDEMLRRILDSITVKPWLTGASARRHGRVVTPDETDPQVRSDLQTRPDPGEGRRRLRP